jgi:phosphatidate phosphatase
MSVCAPIFSEMNCTRRYTGRYLYTPVYTGGSFCTGEAAAVAEARMSFPAGHASYSFYAMVFIAVYIQARVRTLTFRFVKALVQTVFLMAACVTSYSAIYSFQHHFSDVAAGVLIGTGVALYTTLVVGRVLWVYRIKPDFHDFQLKPLRYVEPPKEKVNKKAK